MAVKHVPAIPDGYYMIRPWRVLRAQLVAAYRGLRYWREGRVCTYTDGRYLFGLSWLCVSIHVLQIEMENGPVIYVSDRGDPELRAARVQYMKDAMAWFRARIA